MATRTLEAEIEVDNGYFDSAAFTKSALSSWQSMAALLDHTLLKPEATRPQIVAVCEEAARYRFACMMVNPAWAALAYSALAGSGVPVGSVVGFPLGASLAQTKREEAAALLRLGVGELDMVLNVGALKSGCNARVEQDVRGVAELAHEAGAIVKVILETCLLTVEEKLRVSELAIAAGADFVKTSTGFSTSGATVEDVALLRGVAGARCGVKAAGGIRDLATAKAMLEAGANRVGTSSGIAIVRELGAP